MEVELETFAEEEEEEDTTKLGEVQELGTEILEVLLEQVFEADKDCVSFTAVDAMVSKAINYVTANTPLRSPTPLELQLLYDCRTPPHKEQDEVPTQSSQAAAPAL
jgi:hypothetical protein